MNLHTSVTTIKGVGEKTKTLLKKLQINTLEDLLHFYPREYENYKKPNSIKEIQINKINVIQVTIIVKPEIIRKNRLIIIKTKAKDITGEINLIWYNQAYLKNTLDINTSYIFRGKVEYKYGQLTMTSPKYFKEDDYNKKTKSLQPIYPLTKGITQKMLRNMIKQVLANMYNQSKEHLPINIRNRYHLVEYNYALEQIHYPENEKSLLQAKNRLIFDEFLFYQLAIIMMKKQKDTIKNQYILKEVLETQHLINNLPFDLTSAQKKVWKEILQDVISEKIMNRLIQGDVGSGKTIIAGLALLLTAKNNYQSCLMVPTEVLAQQHYESLMHVIRPYNVRIGLLIGSMSNKQKKQMYEAIESHEIDIVIGTHALIQEKVCFKKLALIITDEQHRFGVKQREALTNKGIQPHTLVMSATPIPRTLALIIYGDLDVSVIDELPPNRQTIKTYVQNTSYRNRIYQFIEKEINNGRQAYIICPMVEESENMELESVIDYSEKLKKQVSKNIKIAYIHGKMKSKEKNTIMEQFLLNKIQILVSTTVIEVGVNVPNSTIMVIENAERFGLAQLHQLRGRVGRGDFQSYCILLSDSKSKKTKERLQVMCDNHDGFVISEYDLKLRGQGDMFGIKQHGELPFKLGDFFKDAYLLELSNRAAKQILQKDPLLKNNDLLKDRIKTFFEYSNEQIPL